MNQYNTQTVWYPGLLPTVCMIEMSLPTENYPYEGQSKHPSESLFTLFTTEAIIEGILTTYDNLPAILV